MRPWLAAAALLVLSGCIKVDVPGDPVVTTTTETGSGYTGPEVGFAWSPQLPEVGERVAFTPDVRVLRGTTVTSWAWSFGDGGTSDRANAAHTYAAAGPRTVTLDVTTSDGFTGRAAHVVPVAPAAGPSGGGTAPEAPLPDPAIVVAADPLGFRFSFTWPAEPDSIGWDFGDGTTSNEAAPTHRYEAPGTYEVALHVLKGDAIRSASTLVTATADQPTFRVAGVGEDGPEPSIGVDSAGAIYFQAMSRTMKSTDHGRTWENVNSIVASPVTLDPYLWLDPVTDRVFANQLYVACSYLTFSDDGGQTWLANPAACGTPVNDHQKMTTGPYVSGSPLDLAASGHKDVYPNVVYYGVNGLADSRVAMSIDGGLTFPFVAESFPFANAPGSDQTTCGGGLHGNLVAGPDGTVYVPSRSGCDGPRERTLGGPVVARSFDNGLTWASQVVADEVGTPYDDKNSDLAIDTEDNVYLAFPGGDNRMWLATSQDHGATWSRATVVTPQLGTTTMPAAVAGSPGRLAIAYYCVWDPATSLLDDPDALPGELAVPDHVPDEARWSLCVTLSLDALAPEPTFHTFRVTGLDPIQVGGISTNSGDSDGDERNLLDFIDAVMDRQGRLHVAFADGCTSDKCRGPAGEPDDSRDRLGTVAILQTGPSLDAQVGSLSALP